MAEDFDFMQLIDQIRTELKTRQSSVLKLSNDTGISAYKIYKWLDGKGAPKHEDSKLLEQWLGNTLEKVPSGNGSTGNVVEEPVTPYAKKNPTDQVGLMQELLESQRARIKLLEERQQSETRLIQVEATLNIIVGILKGLNLPEQSRTPSGESIGEVAVEVKNSNRNDGSGQQANRKRGTSS